MRLLLATLLLLPSVAFATEPSEPPQPKPQAQAKPQPQAPAQGNPDDCARARKLGRVCELTMGEEDIEGGVSRPDGDGFNAREFAWFGSMIRFRRDFIPEIIKTAEDL
ncbi:MAG TPA: hypothetical protein VIV11_14545 [Kofleriaceae bacterium]